MQNHLELMNLYWTTAGVFPGAGEIHRFDFRARVEAAAGAGFQGLGIWHTDLEHTLQLPPGRGWPSGGQAAEGAVVGRPHRRF